MATPSDERLHHEYATSCFDVDASEHLLVEEEAGSSSAEDPAGTSVYFTNKLRVASTQTLQSNTSRGRSTIPVEAKAMPAESVHL